MTVRPLPLATGIAAFLAAVAVLGGVIVFDVGRWLAFPVAVVSLLVAVNALARRRGARDRGETPDPERRSPVPVPGSDLSATVTEFRSGYERRLTPSTRIREGLTDAAVAVLTRFRGLSESEARERVEEGSWTDDPHAAAFLSSELEAPRRSLRERLTGGLASETRFREGIRRTAAAVAAVGYGGTDEGGVELPAYGGETGSGTAPRTDPSGVEGIVERANRETGHWTGIGVVALAAIGIGTFAESAAVVMAGAVGIGYAAVAGALEAPMPEVEVERTADEAAPEPGDEVRITVEVRNESGRFLPDLRVVDGVPPGLAVTDGAARLGTALRPGEAVTFEYTVTARRGTHEFDPVLAVTRDLSRSSEREFLIGAETTIVCEPVLRPIAAGVPLRSTAATFSGRLTTNEGGSGTQFHSVREYRHSDPLSRIDWNRHARTGELATLEFHEERAAKVLVLVDARESCYVAPGPEAPHAVDRSVAAAGRIAATLLADGDTVGLAAIGPIDDRGEGEEQCWLAPGSGHTHRARFQELLATHPQFSTIPPKGSRRWIPQIRRIHRRIGGDTQIVLLSPLADRAAPHIVRWLEARGHAVTVVSPDPTGEETTGQRLASVARRLRRFDLQREGVPVIDWRGEESIDEAFARVGATGGGSR